MRVPPSINAYVTDGWRSFFSTGSCECVALPASYCKYYNLCTWRHAQSGISHEHASPIPRRRATHTHTRTVGTISKCKFRFHFATAANEPERRPHTSSTNARARARDIVRSPVAANVAEIICFALTQFKTSANTPPCQQPSLTLCHSGVSRRRRPSALLPAVVLDGWHVFRLWLGTGGGGDEGGSDVFVDGVESAGSWCTRDAGAQTE